MKILFLSPLFYPHIGGVEKHVLLLSKELVKKGHEIIVVTEKFDPKLKSSETKDNIKIVRFSYPKKKYIGLFYIWYFLWENRDLFIGADIIHIHDVFVWYLPFKFLFFRKKVYTTVHGLEWENPFSFAGILQKKLAVKLSNGTIGVGRFLEKYIRVKFKLIIYGATCNFNIKKKNKNQIVFVGRLSDDTGILRFLEYLKTHKKLKPIFIGDGVYRNDCEKFGKVYGFTNPDKFIKKTEYFVPGGYLACLEGMSAKCKIKVFFNNELKEDYWKMSPMYKFIKNEDINSAFNFAKENSWRNLSNEYIKLWTI